DLDRILGEVKNGEGLVSGSKMGTIGGKILVKWNSNNRKPVFPEIAEYSGKNGTVKIKLKVDNYGNIISYNIEKGSGVPEIDAAIEKVIGSWKINLLKTKKQIGGTFYMNYSFNLK
nr:energy transducer TonB [Fusobacterium sp.]